MDEFEERFIKPIVNASYPGTLAALSLTVLQVTGLSGQPAAFALKITLLLGASTFLLSAFSIFFYSIYPYTQKTLDSHSHVVLGRIVLLSCVSLLTVHHLNQNPILRSPILAYPDLRS
jgi:hypothetical protein